MNLESEVLLKVLDDHDQERQLDAERLLRISRACDKIGAHLSKENEELEGDILAKRYWQINSRRHAGKTHVGAHNLQHTAVDILVRDALDVTISNLLVPNLKRFGTVKLMS